MSDNNEKNSTFTDDVIDLDSDTRFSTLPDFNDPELDDIFGAVEKKDEILSTEAEPIQFGKTTVAEKSKEKNENEEVLSNTDTAPIETDGADSESEQLESAAQPEEYDLFEAAVAKANEKQTENEKSRLTAKLPIFSYADIKESPKAV